VPPEFMASMERVTRWLVVLLQSFRICLSRAANLVGVMEPRSAAVIGREESTTTGESEGEVTTCSSSSFAKVGIGMGAVGRVSAGIRSLAMRYSVKLIVGGGAVSVDGGGGGGSIGSVVGGSGAGGGAQ